MTDSMMQEAVEENERLHAQLEAVTRERDEAHNDLRLARDMARARVSAILQTIGGEVEGRPTSEVNFLQRLRELVQWEKAHLEAVKVIRELMPQRDAARESEARIRAAAQEILSLARDTSGWCECNEGPMCIARTKAAAALSAPAPEPSERMMRVADDDPHRHKRRPFSVGSGAVTPADAVLTDALLGAGFAHVTPWHVRCVEAWAAQVLPMGGSRLSAFHVDWLEMRLKSDLYADGLDALHVEAQWREAWLVAERSARRGRHHRRALAGDAR